MKNIHFTIVFLFLYLVSFGQVNYPTRDSIHIFWQPNLKITLKDYKGIPQKDVEETMDKYNLTACAYVAIWSILDIPEKKRDRYKKFEKVYFAPAFNRTNSFSKTNDTLQIAMENTYLDICEICARWARKKLSEIQDTTKATGTISLMYMTVKEEMEEKKSVMYKSYFKEVYIDKMDGAFLKWRTLIDEILADTKKWATTPEECYRLMSRSPIEDGYIQAPTVVGSMNDKKNKI